MDLLLQILIWLPLAWLGLLLFGYFCSDSLIFPAPRSSYDENLTGLFKLRMPDGKRMSALWLPYPGAHYTLLYSHGNAEDIGSMINLMLEYNRRGWNVLIYDYPGYGTSDGRPSEQQTYRAIETAYQHLVRDRGISPSHIVLYGRSLGGGPSVDLASRVRVGGLILECTYTTTFRVMTRLKILPFDKFENIEKIGRIRCPLLVLHGSADAVVPYSHGRALFAKAPEPKRSLWVAGGGHNDLIARLGPVYWEALSQFRIGLATGSLAGDGNRPRLATHRKRT